MNQTLQLILNTLNQIEVKGKGNIDRMLGVMVAIENLMKAEQNTEPEKEE